MSDKAKLGTRHVCHECSCKYYDLNKPEPKCPKCGADPAQAPVVDLRATAKAKPKPAKRSKPYKASDLDDDFDIDDDMDSMDDDDDDLDDGGLDDD